MVLMSSSNGTNKACKSVLLQDVPEGYFPINFYGFLISAMVIDFVTCPFNILLNTLIIVAVKTKRRLQTHTNILLACLGLTDLMVGLVVQPLHITMLIFQLQGKSYEDFCELLLAFIVSLTVCCAASLYQLTIVSAERYLAIKHTFTHSTVVTQTRLLFFSALAWIVAVLLASFQELCPNFRTLIHAIPVASILLIFWSQVAVYVEARRHEKKILSQQVSIEARRKFMKEKKALKLTTIILVVLILSFFPSLIVSKVVLRYFVERTSSDIETLARSLITLPVMLNSVLNPIIYTARKRQFRVAFVELVLRRSSQEAKDIEKRVFGSSNNTKRSRGGNSERMIEHGVQAINKQEQNAATVVSNSD